AEYRICCRKNRRASVQRRKYASLGYSNRLLLHLLVQCTSIVFFHLIELIYARDALVGQDYDSGFQHERVFLPDDRGGQSCSCVMTKDSSDACDKIFGAVDAKVIDKRSR